MSELNETAFVYGQTINSMDQNPEKTLAIIGQSPLDHADLAGIAAAQKNEKGTVYLRELKLRGHLVLRGKIENSGFTQGVESVLKMALPTRLKMVEKDGVSIRWISPDEWLVVVPGDQTFTIESELVAAMQGHCAIVNVSGGQTILQLSGSEVQSVLQKSLPLDIHSSVFPVGKVASTVFAKTQTVIARTAENEWQLVIRRSFSDYVWLWLQDCCAPLSLVVESE